MVYKITSWQDYWLQFDELIRLLLAGDKEEVVARLRHAQLYVNGMTDGWHEFMREFGETIADHRDDLSAQQFAIADHLLTSLKWSLAGR